MTAVPAPTPAQLAWQRLHLGVFFHVGINTFHGVEWSDGTLPASSFAPTELDADQWVRVAKDAGARYVILTAKHHDGFCLWPTATTDYSVASSPWRDGRGDLVAEVADACRRHGMIFGVYLSPWDRNASCYTDPAAYDRFYRAQLLELITGYGPLGELWFDGAGSDGRSYDWDSVMTLIAEHQPEAMVFNMGEPTIRWVGNEDGLAADPVEYVTASTDLNQYGDVTTELGQARYLPPECDVSIRKGWFWTDHDQPKTLDHLLGIWYRSVGMGANLLLNLPPDDRGLIPDGDVARTTEWRAELDRRFAAPVPATVERLGEGRWRARFAEPTRIDHLRLTEDYIDGQRIVGHRVLIDDVEVAAGLTVGEQRIHVIDPVTTAEVIIEITGPGAVLASVAGFDTGGASLPGLGYRAPTETPD